VTATTAQIKNMLSGSDIEGLKSRFTTSNTFLGLRHPSLDGADVTAKFHNYFPDFSFFDDNLL
jgi:hypothetical protein